MPTLKDIDAFKDSLLRLGDEPATIARWGEALEEPPAPIQEASAAPPAEEAAYEPEPDLELGGGSGDDFAAFLDELAIDEPPPTGLEAPGVGEPEGEPGGLDLPDDGIEAPEGFGAAGVEAAGDDFGLPPELLAGFADEAEEAEGVDDGATGFEDLSAADGFGLTQDLGQEEPTPAALDGFGLPDELGQEEPLAPAPDDFGIPDGGSLSDAGGSDEAADFELPDFKSDGDGFGLESTGEPPAPEPSFGAGPADAADEFSLGSESLEGDSFDQFDLGGDASGGFGSVPELGEDLFKPDPGDVDSQLAALDGAAPEADNFSLDGGWGADFSIPGFEMRAPEPKKADKAPSAAAVASLENAFGSGAAEGAQRPKAKAVELDEAQVDALQDSLLSYPLNLRLAIEDIIANGKGGDEQQAELVWLLVNRAGARDAAKAAGKILKRYIEVPSGFEKRSGAAFEAEKGSFAYVFVHSILPMIQAALVAAAAAAALFFLGYNFAYKPIRAASLYAEGHRQIGAGLFRESETLFNRADELWTMKPWHFRYAEGYAEARQYARAAAMYERLLRRWPNDVKAALDYASMEYKELQAFEKAEGILSRYVLERSGQYFNRDALLLSADNYLAWADYEEQRYEGPKLDLLGELYEGARRRLALVMEKHGRSDAYLERMLVYFMRVERAGAADKAADVEALAKYSLENKRSSFSSPVLAEAAAYLLSKGRLDYPNRLLLSAIDRDGRYPESYKVLADLNRLTGFPEEERRALEFAYRFFGEADDAGPLGQRRVRAYLDSAIRLGEIRMGARENLAAEETLEKAARRYERAMTERVLRAEASFGRVYALLADIHFLERRDFAAALALYERAERNGYYSPAGDYRRGYMHYYGEPADAGRALLYFHRAALDRDPSPYLLWALANSLYERGDYAASQGYFSMLVDRMQFELSTMSLVEPQNRPSHQEIVELLMMATNNLGASLIRVAERSGDASRRARAMVSFTESSRLFDALVRDQATMLRPEQKNLGFLNMDFILHPQRGIDLATYRQLPVDMAYPRR